MSDSLNHFFTHNVLAIAEENTRKTIRAHELLLFSWKTADPISSGARTATRNWFCLSETEGPAKLKRPSFRITEAA